MLIHIDLEHPRKRTLDRIVSILASGGVIAYPTDTAFGIGCDIFRKRAINRIYNLKRISRQKPLSIVCSSLTMVSQYANVSNFAFRILKRYMPGPYTFILPASPSFPRALMPARRTVGIRIPDHSFVQALVQGLGNPVVSATASVSGEEPMCDSTEIERRFGHQLDAVISSDVMPLQLSSVVSLLDDQPEVLRVGKGEVEEFL